MTQESAASYQLRQAAPEDKLALATALIADCKNKFVPHIADAIFQSAGKLIGDRANELGESPTALYLRARLAANTHPELSAELWDKLFRTIPERDPYHLLSYAKLIASLGRHRDAALVMQRELFQPAFAFLSRSEALIKELDATVTGWHTRECRMALLGSATTSFLSTVLRAYCFRDRIKCQVYEGLYGSAQQEILDPNSGLARFRPQIVFLIPNYRDLRLAPVTPDEDRYIASAVENQMHLWTRLSADFGCHVVQHAYDLPVYDPYEYLSAALPGARARLIERLNMRLREAAPSFVSILDTPGVQRESIGKWEDAFAWYSYQQTPSTEALPALAEAMAAHARAVLGLTRKVLITDLDNTLWKGIIGEDGLDGIKIGPGSPVGEAHHALHQYLIELKSRGILLAVASKNNHADACLPFEKHPHMLLRLEDFAAFEANWNDKATSIRAIADKLSLGLDSFVFIDDNPLEREWVRSQLPDVAVIDLGPSVFHYVSDLAKPRYFFSLSLSKEDQARAAQYRTESERQQLLSSSETLEDFLRQLQLRASWAPVTDGNLARVTQLINKTNQFNLTTRRYTEAQVRQMAANPSGWTGAFTLADRMGDYGLIGVILCVPDSTDREWVIDTWLMSCRALGRQMEKFMFDRLIEAAQARGIRAIRGIFRPTAKNALVQKHYQALGFAGIESTSEEVRFGLAVPSRPIRLADHVRDESALEPAASAAPV